LDNRVASIVELVGVLSSPGRVLEALGLVNDEVYKRCPHQCENCGNEGFETLELLGVSRKPLFYECIECGALYLKYNKEWVKSKFKNLEGIWSNPMDWIDWDEGPDPDSYN